FVVIRSLSRSPQRTKRQSAFLDPNASRRGFADAAIPQRRVPRRPDLRAELLCGGGLLLGPLLLEALLRLLLYELLRLRGAFPVEQPYTGVRRGDAAQAASGMLCGSGSSTTCGLRGRDSTNSAAITAPMTASAASTENAMSKPCVSALPLSELVPG